MDGGVGPKDLRCFLTGGAAGDASTRGGVPLFSVEARGDEDDKDDTFERLLLQRGRGGVAFLLEEFERRQDTRVLSAASGFVAVTLNREEPFDPTSVCTCTLTAEGELAGADEDFVCQSALSDDDEFDELFKC